MIIKPHEISYILSRAAPGQVGPTDQLGGENVKVPAGYVVVVNNCPGPIDVYLHKFRPKKSHAGGPGRITVKAGHASPPLLETRLVGAKNWKELKNRDCVEIVDSVLQAPFVRVNSTAPREISLKLAFADERAPRRKVIRPLRIKPRQTSAPVSLHSLLKTKEFKKLKEERRITLERVPSKELPTIASYWGDEDYYICDECGKPIVFRGNPPTPIHV